MLKTVANTLAKLACCSVLSFFLLGMVGQAAAEVLLMPTPDQGVQPRLVQDGGGNIHLLYFKKRINTPAAREGHLYYAQYNPASGRFGSAVRVSSQAFNMMTFALARAAMAVGGDGRVHVMWYLPSESAFYYSRSDTDRIRFETQQSMVSEFVEGIDAGGDVAAFGDQVAIVWGAGDLSHEDERSMYARFSSDNGASFGEEVMIANPELGACACCSLAVAFDSENLAYLAYRSAIDGIGRHMQLVSVTGFHGESVSTDYLPLQPLQEWEASFCPLSTNDMELNVGEKNLVVFETESRIVVMDINKPESALQVAEPFTETRQRNPAVAIDQQGAYLVVWGEAISNSRGGRLNMRLFDADGEPANYRLAEEIQIRDYSFPAAASLPNGDFLVLY